MIGSMTASLVITRATDGDAERINVSGSLRMQSYRIANHLLQLQTKPAHEHIFRQAIEEFNRRVESPVLVELFELPERDPQHKALRYVKQQWFTLKQRLFQYPQISVEVLLAEIDAFVVIIDDMVHQFEESTERKIQWLELIHGVSLALVILIAGIALLNLYRTVVVPIRGLATAADRARHGDLSVRVEYPDDDELGVLVQAFNHMAENLQLMYQDLEGRVNSKTARLREKTASLELLYDTARLLQESGSALVNLPQVVDGLGAALSTRSLDVYLNEHAALFVPGGDWYQQIDVHDTPVTAADDVVFMIEDKNHHYGFLVWPGGRVDPKVEEKHQLISAVIEQIALALGQEWKNEQSHRLMLAEERATIARELHDSIAQALAYLKMQVAQWQTLHSRGATSDDLSPITARIKDGINAAYGQLRELLVTFRLRLDDPGLEAAIKATVAEYKERGKLKIQLNYEIGALPLRANAEIHILQIVREALSNVVRHAEASEVTIDVCQEAGQLWLSIRDNGKGLPDQNAGIMHHGVTIMGERAQSLGADFSMSGLPEGGAQVRLVCPLEEIIQRG